MKKLYPPHRDHYPGEFNFQACQAGISCSLYYDAFLFRGVHSLFILPIDNQKFLNK